MIRQSVLAALADGIAAGSVDTARAAVRPRSEWLVRRLVRRRLDKALVYARFATAAKDVHDPETQGLILQVAALEVAGVVLEKHDHSTIAEAYAALPARRKSRIPIATITAAVVVLALVAGGVFGVLWLRARDKAEPEVATAQVQVVRLRRPPAAGAFTAGGVPLHDPNLEKLLVDDFTDYVLEVNRTGGDATARAAHATALGSAPVIVRHGDKLAAAWRELLTALDRWPTATASVVEELGQDVRDKARVVSEQFAALGLGYYLEGNVRSSDERDSAIVYTYLVDEIGFVVAGGEPRRVLSLRRLDKLNRSWAVLGLHSENLSDPIVMLDKIDEFVVGTVLPVLAANAPYPLGDPAIDADAGRAVRVELAPLSGDPLAAARVGALLGERATIAARWRTELSRQGRWISRLESVYVPPTLLDSLAANHRVPYDEIARVRAIDRELATLGAEGIVANLTDVVAASVRRHEARHGIDADRHPPLAYPAALEAYLGSETDDAGKPRRRVEATRLELAAYLSQIANDPTTTHMTLWHVARYAFDPDARGSTEMYAALVIVQGLARHLPGDELARAPDVGAVTDRASLHLHATRLAGASSAHLRTAAAALWKELYGEPLLAITDR